MSSASNAFVDEIRKIADETLFEFSQNAWEDALIEGFKRDYTLAKVLLVAARVPDGRQLSRQDWLSLAEMASRLSPSLNPRTSWANLARVWIAKHARLANAALWDGNYAKAKRLLKKGGRATDHVLDAAREIREEAKGKTAYFIRARDLSKQHDWNTVK